MIHHIANIDDDFYLSFQEIAKKNKFLFDLREVITDDGYILQLFHIRDKTTKKGAPAVLL